MKREDFNPRSIVITGASSGIGEALALHYARGEGISLALTGRDVDRLSDVAERCRVIGAHVTAKVIDVTQRAEMESWLHAVDQKNPVDLVIANAGVSAGTGGVLSGEPANQVRHVFDVNLMGVLNTVLPLQDKMVERGRGQIAIMSSLAGYRGWPGAPAYCGSKAAVRVYGEALRGSLRNKNIMVSVICPGFVTTRMTEKNDFPMPFIIDSSCAARYIARDLKHNKGRIAFPALTAFFAWFFMVLPDFLVQIILRYSPKKGKS